MLTEEIELDDGPLNYQQQPTSNQAASSRGSSSSVSTSNGSSSRRNYQNHDELFIDDFIISRDAQQRTMSDVESWDHCYITGRIQTSREKNNDAPVQTIDPITVSRLTFDNLNNPLIPIVYIRHKTTHQEYELLTPSKRYQRLFFEYIKKAQLAYQIHNLIMMDMNLEFHEVVTRVKTLPIELPDTTSNGKNSKERSQRSAKQTYFTAGDVLQNAQWIAERLTIIDTSGVLSDLPFYMTLSSIVNGDDPRNYGVEDEKSQELSYILGEDDDDVAKYNNKSDDDDEDKTADFAPASGSSEEDEDFAEEIDESDEGFVSSEDENGDDLQGMTFGENGERVKRARVR